MKEIMNKTLTGALLQYWDIKVSDQFVKCLNKQLNLFLEKKTGRKLTYHVFLSFNNLLKDKPEIIYAATTYVRASLFVNYSTLDIKLCWQAKSGEIYKITDEDIDEKDIRFWMEEIDDEKLSKIISRDYTSLQNSIGENNLFNSGNAVLLWMNYSIEISDEFIICADKQLTAQFEKETAIKITNEIELRWDSDIDLSYETANVSGINTNIWLRYGKISVRVVWNSLSGRVYNLSDRDIDCTDIKFVLQGIDKERCHKLMFPKWSLVTFPESELSSIEYKKGTPVPVSLAFIICYDKHLTPLFESLAGFKVNKHLLLSININDGISQKFYYAKDQVSRLSMNMHVNGCGNKLIICWKSKSGRLYDIGDADIDCNDVEFWFEGFDALLYNQQMFPNIKLPFKLKDLSYELVVTRINIDITIDMQLKSTALSDADSIIESVDDFITDYNTRSVKKDRKYGVVHNWKRRVEDNKLIYEIDTGFTGAYFLKKILLFLSALNAFEKIEVT